MDPNVGEWRVLVLKLDEIKVMIGNSVGNSDVSTAS
jgi:hypothetical protein